MFFGCFSKCFSQGCNVVHQLVCFFAGGIQTKRVVHIVMHLEWHVGVGTINAGTACIHQVFDTVVTTAFKNVSKIGNEDFHLIISEQIAAVNFVSHII